MEKAIEKIKSISEEINSPLNLGQVNGQYIADYLLDRSNNQTKSRNSSFQKTIKNSTAQFNSVNDIQADIKLQQMIEQNNQIYELHYYHDLVSSIPVIRGIIIFIKKVIRRAFFFLIQPIIDEQNRFNISATQSFNELYNKLCRLEESHGNELKYTNNVMEGLQDNIQKQYEEINSINKMLFESRKEIDGLQKEMDGLQTESRSQFDSISRLKMKIKNANIEKTISVNTEAEKQQNNPNVYQNIDYFSFENSFRGSEEDIQRQQNEYLKFFLGKQNIVDLGCGRGEFLSLMKENGISAVGVDIYEEYVEYGEEKGVKIVQGDAVEFLRQQNADDLGGIFCAQLVEHLKPEQIMEICSLSYEKLKKGSCVIFETPNPCCLAIYTNAFYMDPSHIKPVHPETMKYYLKQAGFYDVQIIFTESSKVPYQLPLLNASHVSNLEEFNSGIQLVSNLLFGSQDYAVVACK